MWHNIDQNNNAHYSVFKLYGNGMMALRELFPNAEANQYNFVLFSTSGINGSYTTIEDAEQTLTAPEHDFIDVTFLIIHPRMICMRYGNVEPLNMDDIIFLKRLRNSSFEVITKIGIEDNLTDPVRSSSERIDSPSGLDVGLDLKPQTGNATV